MRGILKYKNLIEGVENLQYFSMGEGETPLVRSRHIGPSLGLKNLFFKLESLNPTGSYKDRFGSLAIAGIVDHGGKLCIGTSSGNTGASLAAYSAIYGISCHLAIIDGAPMDKLDQMLAYGANLWMVKDFGIIEKKTKDTFSGLHQIAKEQNTIIQVSAFTYNPFGMQGVQTISYEISEELPRVKHVFVPAGGGGLTLGIIRGFEKWSMKESSFKIPRVHCVQPLGNNTIAGAIRSKNKRATAISMSTTKISGLQVPNIIDGDKVVEACFKYNGNGVVVKDESIFYWQNKLATTEGILCEPAAATAMAGVYNACKTGEINSNDKVVCLITGHGFKDQKAIKTIIKGQQVNHISEIQEIKINKP